MATRTQIAEAVAKIGIYEAVNDGLLDGATIDPASVEDPITQQANIAAIATPATATAEDVANKVNAVIAALVAAGVLAAS